VNALKGISLIFYLLLMLYIFSTSTEYLKNLLGFDMEQLMQNYKPEHLLSITGIASQNVDTDLIIISINIQTQEFSLTESYQKNTFSSFKISKIFQDLKIPERNITTNSYRVEKVFKNIWIPANHTYIDIFEGYKISNQIDIRLSDINYLSSLLAEILSVGNVLVSQIDFQISKEIKKKIQDSLLREAAEDAFERAKISANMLDVRIYDFNRINVEQNFIENSKRKNENYDSKVISTVNSSLGEKAPLIYSSNSNIETKIYINFFRKKSRNLNYYIK